MPTARLWNLDRLRILAIAEIVAFHLDPAHRYLLFGWGLAFFLLVTIIFGACREPPEPFGTLVRSRTQRLLVPMLFWSLVYLVINQLRARLRGEALDTPTDTWRALLGGTAIHLWFLPFAFVTTLLVYAAYRQREKPWLAPAAIILAVVCVPIGAWVETSQLEWPFPQWLDAAAALPLGLLIGLWRFRGCTSRGLSVVFLTVVAGLAAALLLNLTSLKPAAYVLAVSTVTWAFLECGPPDPLTRLLAPLTYGVYLIHPAVAFVLHFAESRRHFDVPFPAEVLIAFATSAAIAWVMQRLPLLRAVV